MNNFRRDLARSARSLRSIGQLTLLIIAASWIASAAAAADAPAAPPTDDIFVGPFPSWRDVKRDYGAVGDGKADDTAAFQKALDELNAHVKSCVLYVPAGRYRIAKTIRTVRKEHNDSQGVTFIGEDPATTTLAWDGPAGGTLLQWDAWYSKISRLTLDGLAPGGAKAGTLLEYGPKFSTYNETSDIIFRDAANGLVFGQDKTEGQAENEVLRCQFLRCETGLQTVNWNSMDVWMWYCRFEDCGKAVYNAMGNWHVWQSLFLRSRVADLSSGNLMVFSIVNNVSIGSACFLNFDNGHTWGSPTSITGNRVIDPTGEWAIRLGNAGPYLVVDNKLKLGEKEGGIRMTWGDQTLVGNAYGRADAVEEKGRFRRIDEHVVDPSTIATDVPVLPAAPAKVKARIIEVAAGAGGSAIQDAIDRAGKTGVDHSLAVVHLPMGRYKIEKTLIIPASAAILIAGDAAGETGTRLEWAGPGDGAVFRFVGPSRSAMRDVFINVPHGRAIEVTNANQPGAKIFADQLNASGPATPASSDEKVGPNAALRINRVRHADVQLRALQGSGNGGVWVDVIGPGAGPSDETFPASARGQISIFTGATGSAAGQYAIRDGGQLVVRSVYHERSTDAVSGLRLGGTGGILSIDATRFSYATSPDAPTIALDNFSGLFTLAAGVLLPVGTKQTCCIAATGACGDGSALVLNNQFWVEQPGAATSTVWQNKAVPPIHGGLVGCNINGNNKEAVPDNFAFFPNAGDLGASGGPATSKLSKEEPAVDDATILRHLAPLRAARVWQAWPMTGDAAPVGVTNLQFRRVWTTCGSIDKGGAAVEIRAD